MNRWTLIALGAAGIGLAVLLAPTMDLDPDTGVADPSTVAPARTLAEVEVVSDDDPVVEDDAPAEEAGEVSRKPLVRGKESSYDRQARASERQSGPNPLARDRVDSPEVASSRKVVSSLESLARRFQVDHGDPETSQQLRDVAGEMRMAWRKPDDVDWDGMLTRFDEALTSASQSGAAAGDSAVASDLSQARERLDELHAVAAER